MSHKTALLLTNLGSPKAPTAAAVRAYLAEFLSDQRVVEIPRLAWYPILYGIILPLRARKSAKLYRSIWTEAGSPLVATMQRLAEKLQTPELPVFLAMNYAEPAIAKTLDQCHAAGIERLIVLPLYPQYSATTAASCFDRITRYYHNKRYVPHLQFIMDYHQHPAYIAAIADSIRRHWQQHGQAHLLFSFHGLPARNVSLGDPYAKQCKTSARLIAKALGLNDDAWRLVFQSRFGAQTWLQPYCDKTLAQLPKQGIKHVTVICPGFSVDCLETLEEIQVENRDIFINAGGERFDYIPCLNDTDAHRQMLQAILGENVFSDNSACFPEAY